MQLLAFFGLVVMVDLSPPPLFLFLSIFLLTLEFKDYKMETGF